MHVCVHVRVGVCVRWVHTCVLVWKYWYTRVYVSVYISHFNSSSASSSQHFTLFIVSWHCYEPWCCTLVQFLTLLKKINRHHENKHIHVSRGPLARYVKLPVAHAPRMPGTFSPPPRVSDSDMHYGTCMTHVSWCMPGSLTSSFLWNPWWGERSRHSRRMRNPQFYVAVKRPIPFRDVLGSVTNVLATRQL